MTYKPFMLGNVISSRVFQNKVDEIEKEGEIANVKHIYFDPATEMSDGRSLYQPIFDYFESEYKDVTGKDISLKEGQPYAATKDFRNDKQFSKNYNYLMGKSLESARKDDSFNQNLSPSQKDRVLNAWSADMEGLFSYMKTRMPAADTDEGKKMRKRFPSIISKAYDHHYSPAILADSKHTAEIHSEDNRGEWFKKSLSEAKQMLGAGLQSHSENIAQFYEGINVGIANPILKKEVGQDFYTDKNWGNETKRLAKEIFDYGRNLETFEKEKSLDYEKPTGKYDTTLRDQRDRWGGGIPGTLRALADLDFGFTKAGQNIGTQLFTTVPGVALSAAAQLNPYMKGASAIARIVAGAAASAPGVLAGGLLESGDAYSSARDHIEMLRSQAIADKTSGNVDNFEENYGFDLPGGLKKTADLLTDDDVQLIASKIGNLYGGLATASEFVGTSMQSGVLVKNAAKVMGLNLSKKGVKKKFSEYLSKGMVRRIGGVVGQTGKGFLIEGVTEAFQEYMQEELLANMPQKELNFDQIGEAFYAGAYTGGGIQATTSTATNITAAVKGRLGQRKANEEREADLEATDRANKTENDILDSAIIYAGAGGWSRGDLANQLVQDDSKAGKGQRVYIKGRYKKLNNQIKELRKSPNKAVRWIKENKAKIEEGGLILDEDGLSGFRLQPSQIADILGKKVEDLVFTEEFSPEVKKEKEIKKKKSSNKSKDIPLAEEDAIDNLVDIDNLPGGIENITMPEDIEYTPKQKIDDIKFQVKELEKGTKGRFKTWSPEKRQLQIEKFKEQQDVLEQSISKKKVSKPKEVESKEDLFKYTNSQLKNMLNARNISYKSNDVKSTLVSSLENYKPKKSMPEVTLNIANNMSAFANALSTNVAISQDILEGFPAEGLIAHAEKFDVDTSKYIKNNKITDKSGLMSEVLDKQGPVEMGAGVGLPKFIKSKNKGPLFQLFDHAWDTYREAFESQKSNKDKKGNTIELAESSFQEFVEENLGPMLPEYMQKPFQEWADARKPKLNSFGRTIEDINYKIRKLRNKDTVEIDESRVGPGAENAALSIETNEDTGEMARAIDRIKESIGQKNSEASDINAESFNHLNTAFFKGLNITVKASELSKIETMVLDSPKFEDFVKKISSSELSYFDNEGNSPATIVNKNLPLKQQIHQYYISNRAENNVKINSGIRESGELPSEKAVYAQLNDTSKGWNLTVKDFLKSKKRMATNARATMADRWTEVPIVWLNGSDFLQPRFDKNKGYSINKPIYGFLNKDNFQDVLKEQLIENNLVPLFVRGDSDRMAFIEIDDIIMGTDPKEYWEKAVKDNPGLENIAKIYQQESTAFGTAEHTQLANIARHEAMEGILGKDYHELPAHKIMHRIKIMYTPAITLTGGKGTKIKVLDTRKALEGKQEFKIVTHFKSGETFTKQLVKEMNGKLQYVGDGNTITSERKLRIHSEEVATDINAKRAKTIIAIKTKKGTMLVKHQEMNFDLDQDATRSDVILGKEKVAEIRRENGEINIYTEDSKGNFSEYIDHLNTNDESKVQLGDFNQYNENLSLPSEATGHIQYTGADKERAPFAMQITNYMNDPKFLEAVNRLIDDDKGFNGVDKNFNSTQVLLTKMISMSKDPAAFDRFLQQVESKFPDALPRVITEMTKIKAGTHPTQLDYGKMTVKNRLLMEALDLKQEGGVLDFRPAYTRDVEKGNIVLSFGTKMRKVVASKLARDKRGLSRFNFNEIMNMSKKQINQVLKDHPVTVMLVRHPVPSRAGYRMLTVESFETNIGDSFMMNDEDIKEVFEADHDHDTGHISIVPEYLQEQLRSNQTFQGEMTTVDLESMADKSEESFGSLDETYNVMLDLIAGKNAIGEIANVQRISGITQLSFGSMEIFGSKVRVRDLKTTVNDPGIGQTMPLEDIFQHYAQAAFDNVSFRLLNKWNYSQEKLYKMLFYNDDGTELTDQQFQVLDKTIIAILKNTQSIKHGRLKGNPLSLEEILKKSQEYELFAENRPKYIRDYAENLKIKVPDVNAEGEVIGETMVDVAPAIGDIEMNNVVHPHEYLVMQPGKRLSDESIGLDEFYNISDKRSAMAHDVSTSGIMKPLNRVEKIQSITGPMESLNRERQLEILDEIESGEQWGADMRQAMMEMYENLETDQKGELSGKLANSMTWDYNQDFVEFAENWIDGYTTEEGVEQLGFNDLTKVQQITATYQFLEGIVDNRDGKRKVNARKIPPVSKREGESMLDPGVMEEYFKIYNRVASDYELNAEIYELSPRQLSTERIIKEYMGCE